MISAPGISVPLTVAYLALLLISMIIGCVIGSLWCLKTEQQRTERFFEALADIIKLRQEDILSSRDVMRAWERAKER